MTTICIDAGPAENTHRRRGIGVVARSVLGAMGPEVLPSSGAKLRYLARRPLPNVDAGIDWVRRSFTAEWTGVNERLHEVVADYVKILESRVVLPRDVAEAGADVLLSFDPRAIPVSKGFRTVALLYDLIPLRFPEQYLPPQAVLGRAAYAYDLRRLKRADHVVAISDATRADAMELLGIPAERISVAHLAADETRFRPQPREVARRHVADRMSLEEPYFLYVGGFDPRKNLETLISARLSLPDTDPVLAIAGPLKGPGQRLFERFSGTDARDKIRWLGYVPDEDLAALYSGAVALAFPSRYEGFGLPILEAMRCGTPVLTCSVSSMPEVAGDAALYCDPAAVDDLARGLQRIGSDSGMQAELRARGFRQASKFSWAGTATRLLDICSTVAAGTYG